MLDADRVKEQADLVRIAGNYIELKKAGKDFVGLCPFHKEKSPSFTVHKEYFKCFGCDVGGDVFQFMQGIEGLTFPDAVKRVAEIVGVYEPMAQATPAAPRQKPQETQEGRVTAIYHYRDEDGKTLYEICRVEPGKKGKTKDFLQRFLEDGKTVWRKHPKQVLYHLPDVAGADQVLYLEGEKDADSAVRMGFVGTTAAGGCNAKWLPGFTETLRGKSVVVIPDQDRPGLERGEEVGQALKGIAREVLFVHVPRGNDLTEWIELGGTREHLLALIETARQEQVIAALDAKGLLTPAEIVSISGGYSIFCNPAARPRGLQTGLVQLDALTLGMHPGQLIVLAARPAMGKSALALNIAQEVIATGDEVAFFSLEMSREELLTRAVCAAARVDQMRFRKGRLGREERQRFNTALHEIMEQPLLIDDTSDVTLSQIEQKLRRAKARLVVVDYLQLMGAGRAKENRTQEVGAISRGMKVLAKKARIPFLLLSQLNRSAETRPGDHRPQLSDLRESGAIEQDADMVWFIYREEYYHQDRADLRGLAEITIAKQRNGPTGRVKCVFLKEFTRFENMAEA